MFRMGRYTEKCDAHFVFSSFSPESYDFRNTQKGVNVPELLYLAYVSGLSDCNFARCLHDCETRSVTFKKECRLNKVLENRVLRKIFGPKRAEMRENWSTL
jgi:hypothetical protein